jgi:hypothetical protein
MTDDRNPETLTEEEIARATGEPLPDREQMTVIRGADPLPVPLLPDGSDAGEWSNEPVPPGT